MASFVYEFEWDSAKASANRNKHGVDFERAVEIFRDPLALTIPDDEHSKTESPVDYDGKGHVRTLHRGCSYVSAVDRPLGARSVDLGAMADAC